MSTVTSKSYLSPQASKMIQNCMKAANIGPNAVQQTATSSNKSAAETPMFAVVSCGQIQYKVTQGDVFAVNQLRTTIGSKICLKKVLLVGGSKFTAIGRPFLENVRIICDVEENKVMRLLPYVHRPRGMKMLKFKNMPHYATILRVRSIVYEPVVIGELDKYQGNLIDPSESNDMISGSSRAAVSDGLNTVAMNYENLPQQNLDEFQSETAEFFKQFAPRRVQQ